MDRTHLYKGSFNYHGDIHVLHRYAKSERQAFIMMCHALAERLKMKCGIIHYFFNRSGKYEIEMEKRNVD